MKIEEKLWEAVPLVAALVEKTVGAVAFILNEYSHVHKDGIGRLVAYAESYKVGGFISEFFDTLMIF